MDKIKEIDVPLGKGVKIFGWITFGLVALILILDIVFYFTRKVWFSPYKAKPSSKTDVYYPNGKPDAKTGVPDNNQTLPKGVSDYLQGNLNSYKALAGSEWNFITPS